MKKSELRQIIREEVESLFKSNGRLTPFLSEDDFSNKWRTKEFTEPINEVGNNGLPSKDSNWYELAKKFDIGKMDLDKLAYLLKLKDFKNMDISITPKVLFKRDKNKFIKAIQQSSLKAEDMSPSQIQKIIMGLWP